MRFVVVTGMSGAGKTSVLKMLEDMGYFCIDNLPMPLVPKLGELLRVPSSEIDKIALGLDVRSGGDFQEIEKLSEEWKELGITIEVVFLECSDKALIKRYKETRRNHPLSGNERMDKAIAEERRRLKTIKSQSTYILDTSQLLVRELKKEIKRIFLENIEYKNLYISILSFGFKNGIPVDADLVFDVRFLPNPYYIEELRVLSGESEAVSSYVMSNEAAQEFLKKLTDMVEFLIPNYVTEGKNHLVIAIGCTGGKHRSVTLANALYHNLQNQESYGLRVEHRDIQRENIIKGV